MTTKDDALPGRTTLAVLGQLPSERADAARNRRALLSAAHRIVAEQGVDALSMDRVAAAAGVGVGTVYRRFGDRTSLAYALLDDGERQFQAAFISGPPPLGPGAPDAARLRAFLHAYVDRLERQSELLALAESSSPAAPYHSAAYRIHRMHLAALLTRLRPDADTDYLIDALLAILSARLFRHQRQELQFSTDRIKLGLDQLLNGLIPEPRVRHAHRRPRA
ncbi:MAG: TetR/AcrR family transcriptional regulator [Pseudonocardiales bacterium]